MSLFTPKVLFALILTSFSAGYLSQASAFSYPPSTFCQQEEPIVTAAMKAIKIKPIGAMVGVYENGQSCYFSFGVKTIGGTAPDRNTMFSIGSVTKTFTTTMLALKQQQDSSFDVNAPIDTSKLPCSDGTCLNMAFTPTYYQLATFTAGISRDPDNFNPKLNYPLYFSEYTEAMYFSYLNSLPNVSLPAPDLYTNTGMGFLGQVLMSLDGYTDFSSPTEFDQWINANITGPLSMPCTAADTSSLPASCNVSQNTATGYDYDPSSKTFSTPAIWPWNVYGMAGGLSSNAVDMLNFIKANLNVPVINGKKVNPQLLAAMQVAQTGNPQILVWPNSTAIQAYAWVVAPATSTTDTIVSKDGSVPGFSSCVIMDQAKSLGVVVLFNSDFFPVNSQCVLAKTVVVKTANTSH